MMIIYFFYGLSFGGLGLAAYLQLRREGDLPLKKELPWLAAFGFACGATAWVDMFLMSGTTQDLHESLTILRIILQPVTGLLLIRFGWGTLMSVGPLPAWTIVIPGLLVVPIAYVITYASTTFITPSPLEIPIDIWSRYLLYLPGSIMGGLGFLRQWDMQRRQDLPDVARLMLGAGLAFLLEAFVVGLVVPAAPYGPASYYNYDRVATNAFSGEGNVSKGIFGLTAWLDYEQILQTTHLPIEFWRMVSAIGVTFFVVRGLGVFDAIQKRRMAALQAERDRAREDAFEAQIAARETAERWTEALVNISRRIAELHDIDDILLYIVANTRELLAADFVGLAIVNGSSTVMELKCCALTGRTETVDSATPVENPLIANAFRTSTSYRSQKAERVENLRGACFFSDRPARALAVVPLDLDSHPIGAFWIAGFQPQPYSETDLIWLECLADQAVIAIKHGLMTSQLQSLSITEERGRIAREMHDGLAQVLGYLNLQVQTLDALLQQGKTDKLRTKLSEMREAVQVAHADVRENILSLRTTLANEKGLIPAMAEYLEEFGIQSKTDVQFVNLLAGDADLSSVAEVELVCILQEALSNVRKHAGAEHIVVRLSKERLAGDEHIRLAIKDDGVGFQAGASKRSFGLQTMRERAASVSGKLVINSAPGQGTQIECWLPCLAPEKLNKKSLVLQ
ncbi:MAG: GAF domain-containing protein [Chloroflexi bacterium]|nr:GAF domain-containing protein [Chloroflexota bacterium]